MKKTIHFAFLLLLCFSSINARSQVADRNYEKYLSDGRGGTRKNAIKFNLLALLNSDIGVAYERKLSRSLSIEVGFLNKFQDVPPNKFYYFPSFITGLSNTSFFEFLEVKKINPAFMIEPRYYFFKGAIGFRSYVGLRYRIRNYEYEYSSKPGGGKNKRGYYNCGSKHFGWVSNSKKKTFSVGYKCRGNAL